MKESEMIWAASVAIGKDIDYETLCYSDYMHGNESSADEVWEYVIECREIGETAFRDKYAEFKLY